jgi:hypothetical protein
MAWKPALPRCSFCLVCAAVVLAGCQQQEQIHEYTAPKEASVRLLAVMVPRKAANGKEVKETWFFKLMGPADEVAKHVKEFDDFVASVQFTGKSDPPIKWKVPTGWSEEHSDERFYAVVRFAGEGMPLPIQVTVMSANAGGFKANVHRWRVRQLGLDPLSDAELKKIEEDNKGFKVDGIKAWKVDFTNTGRGTARRAAVPQAPAFTFQKPEDWVRLPADTRGMVKREAVFQVKRNGRTAQATVVRAGGSGLLNVNRWRDELGLPPTKEDELAKELLSLDTASGRAAYVELTGRGADGERMTLGAWLPQGDQTWFITMKGPAELVRQQRPAFEAFVKSFRLDGGAGAAHE